MELSRPDVRFHESYLAALDEYHGESRDGDGELVLPADDYFPGVHFTRESLADPDTFAALVAHRIADERPETPRPCGWVPCTFWWMTDGDDYIGSIALRHELNAFLLDQGGHIGYSVRPSRRRRGHATHALALVLPAAAARGIERVLVTCDETNVGSRRTIEANGGVLEDVRGCKRRYWVDTAHR